MWNRTLIACSFLGVMLTACWTTGRFATYPKGNLHVKRDEFVDSWRVNETLVVDKELGLAPGCYVLEVEYSASYVNDHGQKAGAAGFFFPVAAAAEYVSQTTFAKYQSGLVPFALRARPNASYFVTATFTGDEFLPRIVEKDWTGQKHSQIDPARSPAELDACRAQKPRPK